MNHDQIKQEISIIKDMIEKTRKETAQSGLLFIIPGILCIITILMITFLNVYRLDRLVLPALLVAMAIITITSFFIGYKEGKREKIQTYAKSIFEQVWLACSICCLITGLIFPMVKIYSWAFIAVIPSLFIGIGFYLTGIIYKIRLIRWCGFLWWIGTVLLALVEGYWRPFILIIIFFFGYVLPGYILNRQYKNRGMAHEA